MEISSSRFAKTHPSLSSGARYVDDICGDVGGVGSIMGEPKSNKYFVEGEEGEPVVGQQEIN